MSVEPTSFPDLEAPPPPDDRSLTQALGENASARGLGRVVLALGLLAFVVLAGAVAVIPTGRTSLWWSLLVLATATAGGAGYAGVLWRAHRDHVIDDIVPGSSTLSSWIRSARRRVTDARARSSRPSRDSPSTVGDEPVTAWIPRVPASGPPVWDRSSESPAPAPLGAAAPPSFTAPPPAGGAPSGVPAPTASAASGEATADADSDEHTSDPPSVAVRPSESTDRPSGRSARSRRPGAVRAGKEKSAGGGATRRVAGRPPPSS